MVGSHWHTVQCMCTYACVHTSIVRVYAHTYSKSIQRTDGTDNNTVFFHIVWCMGCVHAFTLSSVKVDFHEVMQKGRLCLLIECKLLDRFSLGVSDT